MRLITLSATGEQHETGKTVTVDPSIFLCPLATDHRGYIYGIAENTTPHPLTFALRTKEGKKDIALARKILFVG